MSDLARRLICPLGMRTRQEYLDDCPVRIRTVNGRTILLTHCNRHYLSFELYWKGWTYYEPISMLLFSHLIEHCNSFIDVGANTGYYSLVAEASRPELESFAFEPNPKLFSILAENIRTNAFRIRPLPYAVSNHDGSSTFYLSPSDMSGSLDPSFSPRHIRTIEVEAVSLDSFFSNDGSRVSGPALLKIDVEASEDWVLQGAANTLRTLRPDIILEVLQPFEEETERLLIQNGYRFYQITNKGFPARPHFELCRRGDFVFLNYLVSTRSEAEVSDLFRRLRPRIEALNLKRSNKYLPNFAVGTSRVLSR